MSMNNFAYTATLDQNVNLFAMKAITIKNNIYTLVLTKNDSNQIFGQTYNSFGAQIGNNQSVSTLNSITSAYILPIDIYSNQSAENVLLFLFSNSGVQQIVSLTLNAMAEINSVSDLNITPSTSLMVYEPQIIPNSSTDDFIVLSYPSSIVLYKYTPATPSLTLLRTESFTNQTVKQILPFKGFIIAITQNNLTPPPVGYAHFIALGVNKEFATVNLSSVDGVYLTYDPITQKTLLKTVSDSIGVEIQDAPMPYGVIGMQSTQ